MEPRFVVPINTALLFLKLNFKLITCKIYLLKLDITLPAALLIILFIHDHAHPFSLKLGSTATKCASSAPAQSFLF